MIFFHTCIRNNNNSRMLQAIAASDLSFIITLTKLYISLFAPKVIHRQCCLYSSQLSGQVIYLADK